jgi:hypothetical protein
MLDLAMVVQNVVSALKEAEEVIQVAITAVASKEGLTDDIKDELTETLEAKARNIEESIKGTNLVQRRNIPLKSESTLFRCILCSFSILYEKLPILLPKHQNRLRWKIKRSCLN